jgi:hypothetical protein
MIADFRRYEHFQEVASVISTCNMYQLSRLYKELVVKRGMSIEEVASVVDINLNILPVPYTIYPYP